MTAENRLFYQKGVTHVLSSCREGESFERGRSTGSSTGRHILRIAWFDVVALFLRQFEGHYFRFENAHDDEDDSSGSMFDVLCRKHFGEGILA
jgi:hypothetical protein